jgi:short-subunit dehydrogenase
VDARPFAVITGGSSGIGLALARRLAARGWRLALLARHQQRLAAAVDELGGSARDIAGHVCDVAEPGAIEALAVRMLEAVGGVDLVVANAGIPGRIDAVATGREEAAAVSAVNYLGLVATVHAFWPGLVANGGRVVGVVSVAGTVATPRGAPYAASKHAALAYMRALGAAAPRHGVGVLVANPGPVATPGFPQTRVLERRLARRVVISDDRCADGILRALDDGRREVFLPGWWRAAALLQAAFPGTVARAAGRFG